MDNKVKLYQKLLQIQGYVNGLAKDKTGNSYSYVSGNKLLGYIRPKMTELGLLLKQEIISIDNCRQDYLVGKDRRDKSEILSKVIMRFTWIDTETGETDTNLFGANGQNDWEKGLGSALTYAERYFLLKFFHIPTDEDDIDNPERKPDTCSTQQTNETTPRKKPFITSMFDDVQYIDKLLDWLWRSESKVAGDGKTFSLHGLMERNFNITKDDLNLLAKKYDEYKRDKSQPAA